MVFRLLVTVVVFGIPGAVTTLLGVGYLRTYLRMRRSNPADVRTVERSSEAVELTGTAEAHRTTDEAPFTGTDSLLVDWSIQRYSRSKKSNWYTTASGTESNGFLLDDGTGSALVDPAGGNRHLSRSETFEVGKGASPPSRVRRFLESHPDLDATSDRRRRYRESRLEPGDDVHVFGPVRQSGASWDNPDRVDAVVGVETPRDRERSPFEGGLDVESVVDWIRRKTGGFVITDADEVGASRETLRRGVIATSFGLVFVAVPVLVVLLG